MPRRNSIRAAGALAAALLLGASGLAGAQGLPEDSGLRGSFDPATERGPIGRISGTPDTANPDNSVSDGGWDATVQDEGGSPTTPPPLGGLGDDEMAQAPTPPLGGLGDEPSTPAAEEAPSFGISTITGESGLLPPGLEDVSRHRAILPERHDLDPYVPIGIRVGSFILFPEVEFGTILTDNVLATRFDTQSDAAMEVAPNARLQSDWSRHFFSAEFNGDFSWYRDFPVEDDRIYQILLRGRIDVTRRTHFELEAEKAQTQEGRDSASLTDIAGNQVNLHEEHLTAAADHTFNRLTLKLSGTTAQYRYDDLTDPTLVGDVPFQDIRDYDENELALRGTYEFNPDLAWFVDGAINRRDYKEPVDISGLRRGSDGYVLQTGAQFRLTGKLTGELAVGYGEQQSIDANFDPIQGVLLNGNVIYLPTPTTKIEFLARSEISETTLVDSLGAVDRFYELSLQKAFWTYLILGGYVSYEIADYADNPLVDERVKEGLTAEYYFNPITSVYARYERTDFFSTDAANDFIENEVRIGMRLRR